MESINYWLIKSEPTTYSIEHLKREKTTDWGGVRNFQARNYIKAMKKGDLCLFYHSSAGEETGVYGVGKIASIPHPDLSQFDSKSDYFDSRSKKEAPLWFSVHISYVKTFKNPILLGILRGHKELSGLKVLQKGSRLSILPVLTNEFSFIESLGSK